MISTNNFAQPAWMSLWDRYFAPGDLRQRRNAELSASSPSLPNDEQPKLVVIKPSHLSQADRARRQNGLFFGGVAFTLLSLVVTKRAVSRKLAQSTASKTTSTSSTAAAADAFNADASLEAVQALGYATLNVFSMAMLGMGFAMKYFDFAEVEDLREMVRRQEGYSDESAANKEIEGWIAEVLARKDGQGNLREGVAEKVADIERKRREEEIAAKGRR